MDQKQLEIIQKILASQHKQLEVDAITMVQKEKHVPNQEKAMKIAKEHLITENKNKFPIQEEKESEERRKYTQTFKRALEVEQKMLEIKRRQEAERKQREKEREIAEKIKREKQTKRVMDAYREQEIIMQHPEISFFEKLQKMYEKWKASQKRQNQELAKQRQLHKEFMRQLQPYNYLTNNSIKNNADQQTNQKIQKEDREER